jgi:hypothetical protein
MSRVHWATSIRLWLRQTRSRSVVRVRQEENFRSAIRESHGLEPGGFRRLSPEAGDMGCGVILPCGSSDTYEM